jgi:hypothetical protein
MSDSSVGHASDDPQIKVNMILRLGRIGGDHKAISSSSQRFKSTPA